MAINDGRSDAIPGFAGANDWPGDLSYSNSTGLHGSPTADPGTSSPDLFTALVSIPGATSQSGVPTQVVQVGDSVSFSGDSPYGTADQHLPLSNVDMSDGTLAGQDNAAGYYGSSHVMTSRHPNSKGPGRA